MRILTVPLLACLLLAPTVLAAPRTESAPYYPTGLALNGCATTAGATGVPCFRTRSGDTTVTVSVVDATGAEVMAQIDFLAPGFISIPGELFCGTSSTLTIPAGMTHVKVTPVSDCVNALPSPAGTATATFA